MKTHKKTARFVGVSILMAAIYMIGTGLVDTLLNAPEYLAHIHPGKIQVILGIVC